MDPTPEDARRDLAFVREIVARADRRIDPHAFHFVHWGILVLVAYPLVQALLDSGRAHAAIAVGAISATLGTLASVRGEVRLRRRARLPGENSLVGDQVGLAAFASIGGGVVLSVAGPATGLFDGARTPVIWGLAYANLAFTTGIVDRKEWRWSGLLIFVATVVAMAVPRVQGYVLGPAMGLGVAVPGILAERRVRALATEAHGG